MSSTKGYSKLEAGKEEDAKQPFISNELEEAEEIDKKKDGRRLSKKQKIFLSIFVILVLAVVTVLAVMLHKRSGS